MSLENLELVRVALFREDLDLVQLVGSGNFEAAVDPSAFDPEVEIAFATPGGPQTEYRGFAGLIDGWRDWLGPWASYEVSVEELIDAGERVVALAVLRGQTLRDCVQIEQPGAAVVTVSAGKISRVEFHLDRREALESAGLSA